MQICRCPFSSASPISLLTVAPHRKQHFVNLLAELLFANICIKFVYERKPTLSKAEKELG